MNKRLKHMILFISAVFLISVRYTLYSQTPAVYHETVYLHTDREVYLTGENIRFKVYVIEASTHRLSGLSKAVYVELLNLQHRPVLNARVAINNGTGSGYLKIPGSLITENYTICAHTRWMQNFDPHLYFRQKVVVVNPFVPTEVRKDTGIADTDPVYYPESKVPDNIHCSITTDKTNYSSREKCIVSITISDKQGDSVMADLSMSVKSTGYTGIVERLSIADYLENAGRYNATGEVEVPAEIRGLALYGQIMNYDPGNSSGKRIFLSRIGSMPDVYAVECEPDGRFYLNLRNQSGTYPWIIKSENERYNSAIRITPAFGECPETDSVPPLIFDNRLKSLVEKQMVNYQVNSRFFSGGNKTAGSARPGLLPFFGSSDETILIDEYITLPVTEELFTELVRSVLLEVQRDQFILKILNPVNNQILPGKPLVLFDGVPVFDLDLLMAVDPRKLLKIDVVSSRYVVGNESFGGIISVCSRKGDHSDIPLGSAMQINLQAYQAGIPFDSQVYMTEEQQNDRRPDFRTILHWEPHIQVDQDGSTDVTFYTSDETGLYLIVLQGITRSGKPIHMEKVFEVSR